jgi:addiction module RelB/DinJ family antitoxin
MDAMVTARMPEGKKEVGNAILARLGLNASAAINSFYDYIIAHQSLPFNDADALSKEEIAACIMQIDAIPLAANNRFATMTDDEIRRERLGLQGVSRTRQA